MSTDRIAKPTRTARMRIRSALISIVLAVSVFAAVSAGMTVIRPQTPIQAQPAGAPAFEIGAAAGGSVAKGIAALQSRLSAVPKDWTSWAHLGAAYVQQARVTADPTYYPKAQGAFERSLALNTTENFHAFAGMSALAAARHDFDEALTFGRRAEQINPHNSGVHAVIGDALLELGRYPEAYAAFQRMVDLRPGLTSYVRVSYTWELQGNTANAAESLRLALQSASSPSDSAFVSYSLGELAWNSGDLDKAATWYEKGLRFDGSFLRARAGLAKVHAARNQIDKAITEYRSVIEAFPLPEYVIALGNLYVSAGKPDLAAQQFDVVAVQRRLYEANGVNVDGELALFSADHKADLAEGLRSARAEWDRRQSVDVADTLAWQLYANGRFEEALTYADQSLRLGTKNALYHFHRGMIHKALGQRAEGRRDLSAALAINPHFSTLWSSEAVAALRSVSA